MGEKMRGEGSWTAQGEEKGTSDTFFVKSNLQYELKVQHHQNYK